MNIVTIKEVKLQLGMLCKQKRKAYELSQEKLADALGISRYTIQKLENGKNTTLDTVLKIANHFDLLDQFYEALKDVETPKDINDLYLDGEA